MHRFKKNGIKCMNNSKYKFKRLCVSRKRNTAGRNCSGVITAYHRGGGSKQLFRQIDWKRNVFSQGIVETIEYDPNRSSQIALVRWLYQKKPEPKFVLKHDGIQTIRQLFFKTLFKNPFFKAQFLNSEFKASDFKSLDPTKNLNHFFVLQNAALPNCKTKSKRFGAKIFGFRIFSRRNFFLQLEKKLKGLPQSKRFGDFFPKRNNLKPLSYILAADQLKVGQIVRNYPNYHLDEPQFENDPFRNLSHQNKSEGLSNQNKPLELPQTSDTMYLHDISVGTVIHNIELKPNQGAKLVRSAGTFAQLIQKYDEKGLALIRLPSNANIWLDLRCKASIGIVSHPAHITLKLKKAGQTRWLGKRPIVRGVAMNPIDHPHGGGEGRTKGGRPSVSPWGKPTKSGFRTRSKSLHRRNSTTQNKNNTL